MIYLLTLAGLTLGIFTSADDAAEEACKQHRVMSAVRLSVPVTALECKLQQDV